MRSSTVRVVSVSLLVALLGAVSMRAHADDDARGVVHGVVVDADARPLAGVRVTAWRSAPRAATVGDARQPLMGLFTAPPALDRGAGVETATFMDGTFRFGDLELGAVYHLEADPSGPAVHAAGWAKAGDGDARGTRLVTEPGEIVRGRIVDRDGSGVVARVTVSAFTTTASGYTAGGHGRGIASLDTDGTGRFEVACPLGHMAQVTVFVPGRVKLYTELAPRADPQVITLDAGDATVSGDVISNSGPVAGARVVIGVEGEWPDDRPSIQALTTTDADGHWRIEHLPEGRIKSLAAEAPGFQMTYWLSLDIPVAADRASGIWIPLHRSRVIQGRVRDPVGTPLAGVTVSVPAVTYHGALMPGYPVHASVSDEEGRYRIEGAPGYELHLSAALPGYTLLSAHPDTYVAPGTTTVFRDLALVPARALVGTVTGPDGNPVAGADVHVDATGRRVVFRATTDADGRYRVEGLETGTTLRIHAFTDAHVARPVDVEVVGKARVLTADVRLVRGARIHGRLLDEDGRALPYALVVARSSHDETGVQFAPGHTAETDAGGFFELGPLPVGVPVYVGLFNEDAPLTEVTPTEPGVVALPLRRPTGHRISGRVVDEAGRPHPRVHVACSAGGRSVLAWVGPDGTFELTHLPPPADPAGYLIHVQGRERERRVAPDRSDVELVHPSQTLRWLELRVLQPDGSPVDLATIMVWSGDVATYPRLLRAGWFRTLLPVGAEAIKVGVEYPRDAFGQPLALARAVHDGPPSDEPVVLRLEPGETLSGRAVDETGAPAAGLRLEYMPDTPAWFEQHRPYAAWSDPDGRFQFGGVRPGTGRVTTKTEGGWWPTEPVACAVGEDVAIVVPRSVAIRGQVVGPGGEPVSGAALYSRISDFAGASERGQPRAAGSDMAGRFVIEPVPSGSTVEIRVNDVTQGNPTYVGTVVAGVLAGTANLTIQLERAVEIEGTLTGPDGEPVPLARIAVEPFFLDEQRRVARTTGPMQAETEFRIGGLRPGTYVLRAIRAGDEYVAAGPIEVEAPSADIAIVLRRRHPVHGQVRGENGSGAVVRFVPNGNETPLPKIERKRTRKEGAFRVPNDDDVRGSIVAQSSDGSLAGVLEDILPSDSPFVVELKPAGHVQGRIEELPVELVRTAVVIRLRRGPIVFEATTKANRDGTFMFEDPVPAGTYSVELDTQRVRGSIEGAESLRVTGSYVAPIVLRYVPPPR